MSLISVNGLTFAYEGALENIFENASFRIDTDWRLGFVGRNGRGKTTFLKILSGELAYKGSISASVDFEYFPYPVFDESELSHEVVESIIPNVEEWRLLRELNLLRVDNEVLWRPFFTLS
ncbi:MAG: ATP-binding cassette domain-containing protein, partial [Ruminococcaceae bacterium]|nr:ATP-binding cassette domain-containing protein [Oscillospiraceae bacterium]